MGVLSNSAIIVLVLSIGVNVNPQELEPGAPIDVTGVEIFDALYQLVLLALPTLATQLRMYSPELDQFVIALFQGVDEGTKWRITIVVEGYNPWGYEQSAVIFEVFQPPPDKCTNGEYFCVENFTLIRHPTQETTDLHNGWKVLPNFEAFADLYQVTKASVPDLKSLLAYSDLRILHFEKASHQANGTKWVITIDVLEESKLNVKPLKVEFGVIKELQKECKPGENICVKDVEVLQQTTLHDGDETDMEK